MEVLEKKATKVKNIVYLWDLKASRELLDGTVLAALENRPTVENLDHTDNQTAADIIGLQVCDRMFCTTCCTEFEERDEQKEHFKSDWHRFNLKRRLKGQEIVLESRFEVIMNAGDLSSISGSESSDEDVDHLSSEHHLLQNDEDEGGGHIEGIGKRHPRVFLRNSKGELFSIYRCVIHGKKSQVDTPEALVTMIKELPEQMTWLIIMLAGGHFAAAVFNGNTLVEHKTFHRYVIRAKRGTVQSSHDNKGQAPKSGGASLRRYNEAALVKDIQDLLSSWSEHVKSCHRIFIRAPTYSKSTFYGGKMPVLDKKDCRIRLIPFQTRRPTLKEIHRVHELLAAAECYGMESNLEDHIKITPKKQTTTTTDSSGSHEKSSHSSTDAVETSVHLSSEYASSEQEGDEETFAMTLIEETLDTRNLQTYEVTKKPKKKSKAVHNAQTSSCDVTGHWRFTDPASITLRNDLYTACKTKNIVELQKLLDSIKCGSSENSQTLQTSDSRLEKNFDHLQKATQVNINNVTDSDSLHASEDFTSQTSGAVTNVSQDVASSPDAAKAVMTSVLKQMDATELLNSPFGGHGLTLLHVAASAGHKEVVSLLLEFGADPSVKDGQGQLPYIVASNKDTRNAFRRFMAKYPEKFDYQKAQIPGPLSEEQEKEKKAKDAERKKMLKKAKKERMKEQKLQEAREREEEQERRRFLALSDREKRALAAEKRLTAQAVASGQAPPVFSRCFQCAMDITGKVPFEYAEYKFCSPKCLKQHRTEKKGN